MNRLVLTLIGVSLLLLCCSPSKDVIKMVDCGDHSEVYAEKLPHKGGFLEPDSEYHRQIEVQKMRIEEKPRLMNRLCETVYTENSREIGLVDFKYKGASLNQEEGELVLWYMGAVSMPQQNAGYRAQWVYDLKKGYLTRVHLSVVPLE